MKLFRWTLQLLFIRLKVHVILMLTSGKFRRKLFSHTKTQTNQPFLSSDSGQLGDLRGQP